MNSFCDTTLLGVTVMLTQSVDLSALFSSARALLQRSSECNDEFLTLLSDALSSNLGRDDLIQLHELFDKDDWHLVEEIGWELPGLLLPCACHESVNQRSFALKVLSLVGTHASIKESLLTLSEAMFVHRAVLFPHIDDALSIDDINARIDITSNALSCACTAAATLMNRRLIALPIVSSGRQIASLLSALFDLSAHAQQWRASVTETLEWKQCLNVRPMFDVQTWLVDSVIGWTSRLCRYPEHVQEIAFDLKLDDSLSRDKPIAEMFLRRVLVAALLRLLGSSTLPAVPLKRPVDSILDNLSSEDPAATVFRIIFVGLVRNSQLQLSQLTRSTNTDKDTGSWYDTLDLRGASVLCAVLMADQQNECNAVDLVPFVNSLLSDDEPPRLVLGIQLAQRMITLLARGTVQFNSDTFEQVGLWRCLQLVCQFVIRCPDLQLRRVALQLLAPLIATIDSSLDRIRVVCSAAMQCQHPKLCGTFIQMVLTETLRTSSEWTLEHFKPQLQLISRRLTIKDTPKMQSLGLSADVLALMATDDDVFDGQSNSDAMFRIQIAGSDFISNLEVISGALKLLSACMSVSLSNSEEQSLLFAFCEAIKRHFVPVVLNTCLAELRDVTNDAEQMANQLGITAEHVQQVRQRNAQLEAALHSSHSHPHQAITTSDEDQSGNELMDTLMSMYPKDAQAMAVARRHLLQVKNVIQSHLS